MVRNAATLYGSTLVTSFLGFGFWWVAARSMTPAAVGLGSALLSAAQLIGVFGVVGLNTLVIAKLATDRSNSRMYIVTCAFGSGTVTFLAAVVAGALLGHFSRTLRGGLEGIVPALLFAALASLSAVAAVTDDACVGLLRGRLQLRRNTVFAASKLIAIPALALLAGLRSSLLPEVAWLGGLVLSLGVVSAALAKVTRGDHGGLSFRFLLEHRRVLFSHHWLNVSTQVSRFILPAIVAVVVNPAANAAYYAASLLVGFLAIIPTHLSTALFALAPGDEGRLRSEVRLTSALCAAVGAAGCVVVYFTAPFLLSLLRPSYRLAVPAMRILALMVFPTSVKAQYIAIARVRGRMARAASLTTVGAGLEVLLGTAGATIYGVTGVAVGLLAASTLQAVLYVPSYLSAAAPSFFDAHLSFLASALGVPRVSTSDRGLSERAP